MNKNNASFDDKNHQMSVADRAAQIASAASPYLQSLAKRKNDQDVKSG